jgi:hypothetical protein
MMKKPSMPDDYDQRGCRRHRCGRMSSVPAAAGRDVLELCDDISAGV